MNEDYEKRNKYYEDENNISDYEMIDSEEEEENERIKEYEYYFQTINIINKSLQNYVDEKSLPLCEYMTFEKINKFVSKNLK